MVYNNASCFSTGKVDINLLLDELHNAPIDPVSSTECKYCTKRSKFLWKNDKI